MYKRLTREQARKAWVEGVNIYLLPTRTPLFDGVKITVYTNGEIHKDYGFDNFVDNYASFCSYTGKAKMRYFIEV